MKIYILGTCAGTEPMEDRHHTSIAIEVDGKVYWFDAGENCSYTAHLMGIDLLSVSDIFISHAHIDHIGGLENLLWNIYKLSNVKNTLPRYGDITVHIPNDKTFGGVLTVLENAETGYNEKYQTVSKRITESVISESRMPDFSSIALERITVMLERRFSDVHSVFRIVDIAVCADFF